MKKTYLSKIAYNQLQSRRIWQNNNTMFINRKALMPNKIKLSKIKVLLNWIR